MDMATWRDFVALYLKRDMPGGDRAFRRYGHAGVLGRRRRNLYGHVVSNLAGPAYPNSALGSTNLRADEPGRRSVSIALKVSTCAPGGARTDAG